MSPDERLERQEVEAFLETRRELGPAYEKEIVDAFAERVEVAVEARVTAELARQDRLERLERRNGGQQLSLGIVSMVMGIPTTAITLTNGPDESRLAALVVAWLGIVGVNAAHAWRARFRPPGVSAGR